MMTESPLSRQLGVHSDKVFHESVLEGRTFQLEGWSDQTIFYWEQLWEESDRFNLQIHTDKKGEGERL